MFAVIQSGGKQYRVKQNDVIKVEKLAGEAGDNISLDRVLMLAGDDGAKFGAPVLEGASVQAEIVEQTRGPKIIVFKKKRRKNYRRRNGHRQDLTVLKITDILQAGQKKKTAKKLAAKKPAAETKTEAAPEIEAKTETKAPAAKKAPAKKAADKKEPAKTEAKAPAKKPAADKTDTKAKTKSDTKAKAADKKSDDGNTEA